MALHDGGALKTLENHPRTHSFRGCGGVKLPNFLRVSFVTPITYIKVRFIALNRSILKVRWEG